MSGPQILLLGFIAGFTIFIGLPLGRLRAVDARARSFLNAVATGILVFLLWEVLAHVVEPIEDALTEAGGADWPVVLRMSAIAVASLVVGMMGLVYYERWMARRHAERSAPSGAAFATDLAAGGQGRSLSAAENLALMIAIGIGLHNFAEGLAIGQSAAAGEIQLAVVLVIGFALHNATEGFGIVAPLSGAARLPGWRFLGVMGLIGGGPTFLGTIVGQVFTSEIATVAFLGLAGGSILFVITELLNVGRKFGFREMLAWGLLVGLFLGFATDLVIEATGV